MKDKSCFTACLSFTGGTVVEIRNNYGITAVCLLPVFGSGSPDSYRVEIFSEKLRFATFEQPEHGSYGFHGLTRINLFELKVV